jgi:3alpha(or 20beta)-hydroxysteroid dehydrogenase
VTERLKGKVAIVTGAARGQGEAHACRFVTEGANVVLTDVLEPGLRAVAADLGAGARAVVHDVASEASWKDVIDFTLSEFGHLDVLVNNAAIFHMASIEHETADAFDRILAVNLRGTFLGIRSAIAPMRSAGGGSIINISSVAGLHPFAFHAAYGSSKYGITAISKIAAIELGHDGIRVNSVHPGPIDTDMLPERSSERFANYPLGRMGRPDEVADLVLFLASDESSYITGSAIRIDGGAAVGTIPQVKQ